MRNQMGICLAEMWVKMRRHIWRETMLKYCLLTVVGCVYVKF